MKEATGELNMTVITIIAIAAIAGFFTAFMWPNIKSSISQQWGSVNNTSTNLNNDINPNP